MIYDAISHAVVRVLNAFVYCFHTPPPPPPPLLRAEGG